MTKAIEREQAISAVVKDHGGGLLKAIRRRIRDQIEAEDVYQEVLEEFIDTYDLGQAIETLGAWLIRVAENKILDRFRRRKTQTDHRESVLAGAGDGEPRSENGPDDEWTRKVLRSELVAALDVLPPDQRDVFVKHELEGRSFEQIAAETGVGVNTLLSRKRYAVQFLRNRLKEIYDDLE